MLVWTDKVTGMTRLSGRFHPQLGQRIANALDAQIAAIKAEVKQGGGAVVEGLGGPEADLANHRDHLAAHALARLVVGAHRSGRPGKSEINILVDEQTLILGRHDGTVAEYSNGDPVDLDTIARLLCTSDLHRIIMGTDGVPLDVGRASRLATEDQRRALRAMYRTCFWPGCDVAFDRCEIHHIDWWEHDGNTDLDKLVPGCTTHHHRIHDHGYTITLDPQRGVTIRAPDGTIYLTGPPPTLQPNAPPGQAA